MPEDEIERPAYGAPCNGCGYCCREIVCYFGSWVQGLVAEYGQRAPGPCPALTKTDEGWQCGMVLRPKDYTGGRGPAHELRAKALLAIGAGAGCDSDAGREDEVSDAQYEQLTGGYLERHGREKLGACAPFWANYLEKKPEGSE